MPEIDRYLVFFAEEMELTFPLENRTFDEFRGRNTSEICLVVSLLAENFVSINRVLLHDEKV
ncbi:hypothetical protein C468_00805 [Halorubrum kocurii JCM 14978]|uniref:Uncharacterized protein n=1 Tax=Halorubrum kocurii JCM 14978 TaxID=1230456 RepID=M0PMS0_9EURY|nr:hypothetical protein C468_00805 [Halorubrum kocurii JCM 14978]